MIQTIDKVQMFREIVGEMADLYAKKNANYADSFGQLYDTLGPTSGLIQLYNRLYRLTNLTKGGINNFESAEDAVKDLACYAVMMLIEMKLHDMNNYLKDKIDDSNLPFGPVTVGRTLEFTCADCPYSQVGLEYRLGDSPCTFCQNQRTLCSSSTIYDEILEEKELFSQPIFSKRGQNNE